MKVGPNKPAGRSERLLDLIRRTQRGSSHMVDLKNKEFTHITNDVPRLPLEVTTLLLEDSQTTETDFKGGKHDAALLQSCD